MSNLPKVNPVDKDKKKVNAPDLAIGQIVFAFGYDPQKILMCKVIGAENKMLDGAVRDDWDWFYSLESYPLGKRTVICRFREDIKEQL